jgi:aldehyde dehydrogenase (NAD+)
VRPYGVAGQVIPWNFPLLMAAWKMAPALACGNTLVLKPAEFTPLTAMALAGLVQEAGFPEGVINIITGGGEAGAALVGHPGVDKVAFTGSTAVGKAIQRGLAGTGKPYTLELGGKAAHLIFEDAALDEAVEGVVNGIFFNQGHVCCAGSRLLVQEGIYPDFMRRLEHRIGTLVMGDPLDKNTDIGAINNAPQMERISCYLAEAREQGLDVWQGGQAVPERGYWCRPTVVRDAPMSARIVREEVFGPVLAVQTFRTAEEAVEKANNTRYGLSGGVWTDKGSRIFKVGSAIRAGVLWANTFNKFDPTAPFGGFKESGIGREGGWHGLQCWVRTSAKG